MSHQWDKNEKKVNEQLKTIKTGISRREWKTLFFVIIIIIHTFKSEVRLKHAKEKKLLAEEWRDYYMRRKNSSSEDMTSL